MAAGDSPETASVDPYLQFMADVQREYIAMGAIATLETTQAGRNIDILVEQPLPDGTVVRSAIECKNWNRRVGVNVVEEFGRLVLNQRHKGLIDKGVMVSKVGFSPAAQTTAATYDILLTTYDDLRWRLTSLHAYARKLLPRPESGTAEFIPLSGTRFDRNPVDDVLTFLHEWLHTDETRAFISGEGGSGKTTVCKRFVATLAEAYLNGDSPYLPVYVDMNGIGASETVIDFVVRDFVANRVPLENALVTDLIAAGRICLIIDGIDEFALGKSGIQRRIAFSGLAECATPAAKILVTCRSTFFRSEREMLSFELTPGSFPLVPTDRPHTSLSIEDLPIAYVRGRLEANSRLVSVMGPAIPEWLVELCVRPMHLAMVESALDRGLTGDQLRQVESRAELYELYVSNSFAWDSVRGGACVSYPDDRRLLYEALAVELLTVGKTVVDQQMVTNAKARAGIASSCDPHELYADVCNGILLRMTSAGVTWAHKSFGEFLAASHIVKLIRDNAATFGFIWFGRDERAFIVEMLGNNALDTLRAWLPLDRERYEASQFASFILGGYSREELTDECLDALRYEVEWREDVLTRINCANTLGFLGDEDLAPELVSILMGYLTYRRRTFVEPPYCSRREYRDSEFESLAGKHGLDVVRLHIKETMDALGHVGSPDLIPFLAALQKDEDESVAAEAQECVVRLSTRTGRS